MPEPRARRLLPAALALGLTLAAGPTRAEPGRVRELRLMIYNVALLPWIAGDLVLGNRSQCRAERLGLLLNGLDVLALNETMNEKATEALYTATPSFPHRVLNQPDGSFWRPVPGGVSVLSRYPIAPGWHAERFEAHHGINSLASQGFLHVVVDVGEGLRLNVIATHLDTFEELEDKAARRSQLAQLTAHLERSPDAQAWPTFLLGDLNIDGLDLEAPEYRSMLSALDVPGLGRVTDTYLEANGPWAGHAERTEQANTDLCGARLLPCDSRAKARVDYVLYWDHPKFEITLEEAVTRSFPDAQRCGTAYLSDHKAVEVRVRIAPRRLRSR